MKSPLNEDALNQLFFKARSYNSFSGEVSDETLKALFELVELAPTSANQSPARFVFIRSPEAKAKLEPALLSGNVAKTRSAPVTVLVAYDIDFHEHLPQLFSHADAKSWFPTPEAREGSAKLNANLQAAYLIMGARALGLDVGPMTGFNAAKADEAFFGNQPNWRSFMVINLGEGDPASVFERLPRFEFEQVATIV